MIRCVLVFAMLAAQTFALEPKEAYRSAGTATVVGKTDKGSTRGVVIDAARGLVLTRARVPGSCARSWPRSCWARP